MAEREVFLKCFPTHLQPDVNSLLNKTNWQREYDSSECFEIKLEKEIIHIPYRIYYKEPVLQKLTANEELILDCIFTRHDNGYLREKRVKNILTPIVMLQHLL